MSGIEAIGGETLASIRLNERNERTESIDGVVSYRCGCELRPLDDGRRLWWLCSYHEGFEDGAEAGFRAGVDALVAALRGEVDR